MRIRNQVTGTCAEVADGTDLWDDWVADSAASDHVTEPKTDTKTAPKRRKGVE